MSCAIIRDVTFLAVHNLGQQWRGESGSKTDEFHVVHVFTANFSQLANAPSTRSERARQDLYFVREHDENPFSAVSRV